MRALDPDVAVAGLRPLSAIVDEELASSRIINGLFVGFAVLALLLAAGGLFGVISYSVGQRRREIGIRLALGAAPPAIGRMIVREGLKVVAIGVVAGLLLAAMLASASQFAALRHPSERSGYVWRRDRRDPARDDRGHAVPGVARDARRPGADPAGGLTTRCAAGVDGRFNRRQRARDRPAAVLAQRVEPRRQQCRPPVATVEHQPAALRRRLEANRALVGRVGRRRT